METIKLKAHIDSTGKFRLELPTQLPDREVEVLVVLQPVPQVQLDLLGYPVNYFEQIDAIIADDMIERGNQGKFETQASRK